MKNIRHELEYGIQNPVRKKILRRIYMAIATLGLGVLLVIGYVIFLSPVPTIGTQFIPPKEWLVQRDAYVDPKHVWNGPIQSKPGDEIWLFKSPPSTWHQLRGAEGVCLVRDGTPIDGVATRMN